MELEGLYEQENTDIDKQIPHVLFHMLILALNP